LPSASKGCMISQFLVRAKIKPVALLCSSQVKTLGGCGGSVLAERKWRQINYKNLVYHASSERYR
jgi:hypothetical protein